MNRFVLTAQLQLQAPSNTRQVIKQVRNQLANSSVTVPVEVRGAAQAQRDIRRVAEETQEAANAAEALGRGFGLAIRRFAAFTVASRAVSLFTNSLANAVNDAIEFQAEIVKISQVTGTSVKNLRGLKNTIDELSTGLGVASKDLLAVTTILSQAGVYSGDLDVALSALAKTTLAPTFDDITDTAEGAIAILSQFGEGVGALESQLGSMNRVAGQFAVESGDLIGAVRRFGGVFKSSGGDLNELLAIFTSVRQTTRESAESISTGLRTIFTRIQRPETIEFLRQFGIELTTVDGKFKGPMEATRLLGDALADLPQGDLKFIAVAEELGGFRQIGKVIPLLQQTAVAERALAEARAGSNSLNEDAATKQAALATQILKVKEEFQALVRSVAESTGFQIMVTTSLELASALIKVADSIKPLIPLIATIGSIGLARGIGGFFAGAGATVRGLQAVGRNRGGVIPGFATGGLIPGYGNTDNTLINATPGEFVIKKSSVKKLGHSALSTMNQTGSVPQYAKGGTIQVKNPEKFGALVLDSRSNQPLAQDPVGVSMSSNKYLNSIIARPKNLEPTDKELKVFAGTLNAKQRQDINMAIVPTKSGKIGTNYREGLTNLYKKEKKNEYSGQRDSDDKGNELEYQIRGPFPVFGIGTPDSVQKDLQGEFKKGAELALHAGARAILDSDLIRNLEVGPIGFHNGKNFDVEQVLLGARTTIEGYLLEAVLGSVGDLKVGTETTSSGIRSDFDFPEITPESKRRLVKLFDPNDDLSKLEKADAKRTRITAADKEKGLVNKIVKFLKPEGLGDTFELDRKASGGSITDTVPVLVTPGEFVVNKKSAQSIGYTALNKMNKTGLPGYAKGGAIGPIQKFSGGGQPRPVSSATSGTSGGFDVGKIAAFSIALGTAQAVIEKFGDTSEKASDTTFTTTSALKNTVSALANFLITLVALKGLNDKIQQFGKSIQDGSYSFGLFTRRQEEAANSIGSDTPRPPATAAIQQAATPIAATPSAAVPDSIAQGDPALTGQQAVSQEEQTIMERRLGAAQDSADLEIKRSAIAHNQISVSEKELKEEIKAGNDAKARIVELQNREETLLDQKVRQINLERAKINKLHEINELESKRAIVTKKINNLQSSRVSALEKGNVLGNQQFDLNNKISTIEQQKKSAIDSGDISGAAALDKTLEALKAEFEDNKLKIKGFIAIVKDSEGSIRGLKNELRATDGAITVAGDSAKKHRHELQALQRATDSATREMERNKAATVAAKNAATASAEREVNKTKELTRARKEAERATANAAAAELHLSRERRRANIRSVAGGAVRVGGKALGLVGVAAAVNQFISTALGDTLKQIASRHRDRAIDKGNVGAAGKAARANALVENTQETLSLSGIVSAYLDPKAFKESQTLRVHEAEASAGVGAFQSFGETAPKAIEGGDLSIIDSLKSKAIQAGGSLLNLDKDSKKRRELEESINSVLTKTIESYVANGASLQDATNAAINFADGNGKLEAEYVKLVATLVNAREVQIEVSKANIESLKITSAFGAANTAVSVFSNGLKTGSDALSGYIMQLEAAQGSVGVDAKSAIDSIEKELLKSAGNSGLGDSIKGQADTARTTAEFLKNIGGRISNTNLNRENKAAAEGQLRSAVTESLRNVPLILQSQLRAIANAQISTISSQNFQTTDISEFIGNIASESQKLYTGLLEGAKKQSQHNQEITKLYEEREAVEQKAIESLNSAIDAQFEAAKIFEDFGGAKLSSDQALGGRLAQFNNIGSLAGVGLRTGDSSDINRVASEISNTFNSQQQQVLQEIAIRSGSAFSGSDGYANDKREEAKAANEALITFTRQRVDLLKEELTIVQAKNREEKSALEKLISGDIKGFIEGQAAAGAGAALASGSRSLSGLFSSSALGAGFKSLQDQGLDDRQLNRAANLTLGKFGIADKDAAGVLSGTTSQEQAIKEQGKELARTLGGLAGQDASFEKSEISIKDATIIASKAVFQNELSSVAARNQGYAKGGVVYASRGMFVPRGTDTVPAMLTPGEFVVNRSAVKRGNNMQILKAMNGGNGSGGSKHMSGGGRVYYSTGGEVESFSNVFANLIPQLRNVFSDFSAAVDKLANTKFSVKLDTTNVNVNLNGATFLNGLKDSIRNELLGEIAREIGKTKQNSSGDLEQRVTVL